MNDEQKKQMNKLRAEHAAEQKAYYELEEILKDIPLDTKTKLIMWLDPSAKATICPPGKVTPFDMDQLCNAMLFLILRKRKAEEPTAADLRGEDAESIAAQRGIS